jgi:hypothetical protein
MMRASAGNTGIGNTTSDPERRDMPAHTILQSHESDVAESWDEEDRELGTDDDDIDDEDEDEI